MKKNISIIVSLIVWFFLSAYTWVDNIATQISSSTIGAASSSDIEICLGSITMDVDIATHQATGDVTNTDQTITDTDTSKLIAGCEVSGTGIPAEATVASITSATEFELSDAATATNGDTTLTFSCNDEATVDSTVGLLPDLEYTYPLESVDSSTEITFENPQTSGTDIEYIFRNFYTYINLYITITGDSSADSATLNIYSSGDEGTTWTTDAHYSDDIESLASVTKTITYKISTYMYPWIKVEIVNNTTESGADDDVVATIKVGGYY